MRLVIADTSPIFYLLAIEHVDILPRLFEEVILPEAVLEELRHPSAASIIQSWTVQVPSWARVMPIASIDDPAILQLGAGERAAITLAMSIQADLILIDERKATTVALSKGFEVTGTLGILNLAAHSGLLDLDDAFKRLKRTNFRYRQEILDALLYQRSQEET